LPAAFLFFRAAPKNIYKFCSKKVSYHKIWIKITTERKSNMRKVIFTLFVAAVLVMSLSSFAAEKPVSTGEQAPFLSNAEITLDYWMAKISGNAQVRGNEVDVVDDLGVDDSDNVFKIGGIIPINKSNYIDISYFSLSYSGSKELGKNVIFNGVTYNLNEQVSSKASADIFDVKYKIYPFSSNDIQLGFLVGFKYLQTEASISSLAHGSEKGSVDVALPEIGIGLKANIQNNIFVTGELSGLTLSYQDVSATLWELDIRAEYDIIPNAGVIGGYKYYKINPEKDDDKIDFEVGGLYLGAIVKF
jgi:hypothetical protein